MPQGYQKIRGHGSPAKLRQQLTREIAVFRPGRPHLAPTLRGPITSWWTEGDFDAAFARELPRILAIKVSYGKAQLDIDS